MQIEEIKHQKLKQKLWNEGWSNNELLKYDKLIDRVIELTLEGKA